MWPHPLTPALSLLRGEGGATSGLRFDDTLRRERGGSVVRAELAGRKQTRRHAPNSRYASNATPSPLNGERAGVRGKAVRCALIMESGLSQEQKRDRYFASHEAHSPASQLIGRIVQIVHRFVQAAELRFPYFAAMQFLPQRATYVPLPLSGARKPDLRADRRAVLTTLRGSRITNK